MMWGSFTSDFFRNYSYEKPVTVREEQYKLGEKLGKDGLLGEG